MAWHLEDEVPVLDCGDEAEVFYQRRGVHIVPIYALTFIVGLSTRAPGQTFSNWDVREKLKRFVHPHELKDLKVLESTNEYIKFVARVLDIDIMDEVITILDNVTFRAPGFESALKVNVRVGGYPFPKPDDWAKHFRGNRLNEKEPGERPDTIHVSGLPYEWFAPNVGDDVTSIMLKIMSAYGKIRQIDIPQEDPYRSEMEPAISGLKLHWFNGSSSPFFEMYVQYEDYEGFYKAMTKMGGHQLVRRAPSGILSEYQYSIDFDRSKHLSNRNIIQRELARQCIILRKKQEKEEAEKKALEELKRRPLIEAEKEVLEARIRNGIVDSDKQRQCAEELLRKKLKDRKRLQTLSRITESENLLKYLLVDEVIRQEWEKEQQKKPTQKIRDYVKANKLPDEKEIRERLMKKREIELRSEVARRKFDDSRSPSYRKPRADEEFLRAINKDLTQSRLNVHAQRQQMYRDMKQRRSQLIKEVDRKLRKFRSKFRDDRVFEQQRLAAPTQPKSITINITTRTLQKQS